jgi:D-aminopeptidase
VEGSCCCEVEEAGAAALVGAACDVGVSDVAGDCAAAGEVFPEAETITWRMFSAAACSLSTRSPRDTTTGIRQPARVTKRPKVCAFNPVRILGRREGRG